MPPHPASLGGCSRSIELTCSRQWDGCGTAQQLRSQKLLPALLGWGKKEKRRSPSSPSATRHLIHTTVWLSTARPLGYGNGNNVLFGCRLGPAKKPKGFLGHCPRKVGRSLEHNIYRMKHLMYMGASESCAFLQTCNPTAHPTTPQDSTASTTDC